MTITVVTCCLVVEAAQPDAELLAHARVEGAERLVEEQDTGLDGERAGERHTLPLAARKLCRVAVGEAVELDEAQQLVDALGDLRLRPASDLEAERDVLAHGHVLERGVVLEDEADAAILGLALRHVLALEAHRSGVRLLESGHDPQQRRLAAAGRAEERRQRAGLDLQRDVVECDELPEPLADPDDLDAQRSASFGLRTIMVTSTRIAMTASTIEIA